MARIVIIVLIFISSLNFAQYNGKDFSLFLGVDYATSAQIFLNPNSSDIILRNKSFEIANLYGPAFDFRYRLTDAIIVGLSSEYLSKSVTARNLTVFAGNQIIRLEVEDGVIFIPLEASVHYHMPFSTELFKFTMAAGLGMYYGEQTRSFGDTKIRNIKKDIVFGLLVSMGMEYFPLEQVGVRLELKFRDPEINVKNQYEKTVVNYKGTEVTLLQDNFDSKINLDGISFLLGMTFQF
jgi:outer membrane protein W